MLWLKAFHIIALVCWFAAIFYLPRLFVYHCQALAENDARGSERFKVMERKLYRGIMTPSAIATAVFGIAMLAQNPGYYFSSGWMHAKLFLVLLLFAYHGLCGYYRRQFASDNNQKSETFFRMFNEAPVLLLLAIIILAIIKPF